MATDLVAHPLCVYVLLIAGVNNIKFVLDTRDRDLIQIFFHLFKDALNAKERYFDVGLEELANFCISFFNFLNPESKHIASAKV